MRLSAKVAFALVAVGAAAVTTPVVQTIDVQHDWALAILIAWVALANGFFPLVVAEAVQYCAERQERELRAIVAKAAQEGWDWQLVAVKRWWIPEWLFAMFKWIIPYWPFSWIFTAKLPDEEA